MSTQKFKATQALKTPLAFISSVESSHLDVLEIKEIFTLGRSESNHLAINDNFVSARHARIEWREGTFILKDLRSCNGTYLNGARVLEAPLSDNDHIRVGCTELLFKTERDKRPQALILTSKNTSWNQKLRALREIAKSDLPVLIGGPSGTGKEVLAQQLHRHSYRKEGPFVSVNCSALSETLAESELFGHAKGSFTDATHDRKGAFECARNGTLFLDEIGDLPLTLQPKLLRALENKEIRPVGSDKTLTTDVRILAATHHKLKERVLDGTFRADLYFRLNILSLNAPALKHRMEDFEDLLYACARQFGVSFSTAAIDRLKNHNWPGNIRELKTAVARAKALCDGQVQKDDVEKLLDLFPEPFQQLANNNPPLATTSSGNLIKDMEKSLIERRLIANLGNQRKTASDLGLPKSTLHDRIKSYNINIHQLINKHLGGLS